MADQPTVDGKVRFTKSHLSTLQPPFDDDDDDEFADSLDALTSRRESGRRRSIRKSPKKGSLTLGSDCDSGGKPRRRSSTMTSASCDDVQISIEEPDMAEEKIFESIRVHKELIEQVKKQPWKIRKRLKIVRRAKAYVTKHEGELEERLAHSKNTKDIMARYSIIFERYWERLKREAGNLAQNLIPWEMRIKRIESHFGSVVSSYFTFLRWIFWVNIVMSVFISCFVIVPEYLGADRSSSGSRKEMTPEEESTAFNLKELLDFEGFLKYSPLFYGYYNDKPKTPQGYRLPLAYFMTLMGMYAYSFAAILRRMAHNTRLSKLTDKDEDCTFTWKLYTGWDYMIGNAETADNKVSALIMSFKENILEERERKKEDRNWKIFGFRLLANIIVLILLLSSAFTVIKVVERSREDEAQDTWWRQNEVTVIVSLISTIYPNLFDIIGTIEYNHPRIQLRWQLGRIMILYLLNLYTLIFALFSKVNSMSSELRILRPNTTISPMLSTTSLSVLQTDRYDPTGVVGSEANFSLLTNISDEAQLRMPRLLLDALLLSMNVFFKLHNIWLNSTCVMTKVYCDTRIPLCINTTMYPTLENDDWFNEMTPNSLRNLSESSNFTATMESFTLLSQQETTDEDIIKRLFTSSKSSGNESREWWRRPSSAAIPNSTDANIEADGLSDWNTTKDTLEPLDNWSVVSTTPFPLDDNDGVCDYIKCIDTLMLESTTTTPGIHYNTEETMTTSAEENNTSSKDTMTGKDGLTAKTRTRLRALCWETNFGQELVKLTVMDLVITTGNILVTDFIRALFVRIMNHCWCWDLEKQFPGYGDFKIAENILHLVNNQGMIWLGMFFSPGIPTVNMVKLVIILYVRSWAVLTCNIPHETVFKASRSNNFYYALLLTMLFLCTLPVGFAVVWLEPSWHCGPFSDYPKIYYIFTSSLKTFLPDIVMKALDYAASPGIVIPLLVLLILVIYYLSSVANSLREANKDLKIQLRRERTEERRKVFQMADTRHDPPKVASKWAITKKILPVQPSTDTLKQQSDAGQDDSKKLPKSSFGGSSAFANVIGAALKAKKLKE